MPEAGTYVYQGFCPFKGLNFCFLDVLRAVGC